MTSVISPVIGSTRFETVRVVSAALILTDLGSADTRQGRIVRSNLMRSTILKDNEVSLDMLEDQILADSQPLSTKPVKAIYYPVDYSSTDLVVNSTVISPSINAMCPILANVSTGSGRTFNIEIVINFEVVANYDQSDLFAQGLSNMVSGNFDLALYKLKSLISAHGPKLIDLGLKWII